MPMVTSVPGIYIEEDASPAISVSQGATAIPLFIGRFSPLDGASAGVVTRVSSWLDFCQKYSAAPGISASVAITSKPDSAETPTKYTYTVGAVSVTESLAALSLQLYFQNGGGACYICAVSDTSDEALLAGIVEQADGIGEITLFAVPENDSAYRQAIYGELIGSLDQNKGYFLLADSDDGKAPKGLGSSAHIAVYYPSLVLNSTSVPTLDDGSVEITGYTDIDPTKKAATLTELQSVKKDLADNVSVKLTGALPETLTVMSSALLAGVYCKTDAQRGVWKAPANVVLNGVSDVSVRVTDDTQGEMNLAGVNVIRYFKERGLVVWGARTLLDDDNWRYIPVRRLFDAAERDIQKALRPMVFEPNNQLTWKRVQAAIDHYLYSLWQQGGLLGNKADEAYFVRIGKGITMTTDDINQGKMIVQVGMAAVRPAEFIILQFTQDMAQ